MQKRLAFLVVALSVFALPLAAQAQHKSPLADAPAIRKRLELRSTRLRARRRRRNDDRPGLLSQRLINVKLGFHITDWLSLAGFGGFAVANLDTGFKDSVVGSLPPDGDSTRAPAQGVATGSMNKIQQMLGAQLEVTPFTGKYSLFGKLFAHYDFYAFVGPGFINYAATDSGVRGVHRQRHARRSRPTQPDAVRGHRAQDRRERRRRHPQLHQPVPGAELRAARHHLAEQRRRTRRER